jgi:hypothetical protein
VELYQENSTQPISPDKNHSTDWFAPLLAVKEAKRKAKQGATAAREKNKKKKS